MRALLLLWSLFPLGSLRAQDTSDRAIRAAATRAIVLMQSSQHEWDEGWACASCHHQYLPAIAYQAARGHGIAVDEKIARADAELAFRGLAQIDDAVQGSRSIEPSIGEAYRLWSAEASGIPGTLAMQAIVRRIAGRQQPDGHWSTMDQRPPQSYSPFTTTALAVRSLRLYGHPNMASEVAHRVELARAWLLANDPGDTEGRAFKLLGLAWAGERAGLAPAAKALLRTQQPDGGWSSVEGRPSDAYSTGEALVALFDGAHLAASDASWRRGIAFLLRTQEKDGSWHVSTRLHPPAPLSPEYFESGYPYEHDQYLSIMGASWAVMALTRTLGPVQSEAHHERPAKKNWTETVLFGSAEELRRLLDSGFDPNTATPEGTTALMMAVPDLAKAKLLLDRGAMVNARARSKFTALDVAAQYRDSAPVLRLLLESGAKIVRDGNLESPHALVLAAFAGNTEALQPLKDAGAGLNDAAVLGGVLYASPLLIASMTGDAETLKQLLDLGADVNQPDREGLTALMWATLANRRDAVRVLLDRGADPNPVDSYGMTALLYAASIDYGDSMVLDLLLKHGARKDAKTKEGLTAVERARMFHHQRLVELLQ